MQVAFLGLGAMGRPMARNLARAGFTVKAWNRTPRSFADLNEAGVTVCRDLRDAVAGVEAVCLCLLDDAAVRDVLGQAFPLLQAGTVILDHTTIGVATARELARQAQARGLSYLDAPVSGGSAGAEAATLTIMVGGDPAAYRRVRPVLKSMGRHVRHMGPAGSGQAAKLINQLLTAIHQAAAVEALYLARLAGLDQNDVHAVLRDSYGASRMLDRTVPVLASEDFNTTFTIRLLVKDLGLVADWARELGVSLPLLATVRSAYEEARRMGLEGQDNAALIKWLEAQAARAGHLSDPAGSGEQGRETP